ncbi:MAG: endolytic transglycosylase MltG [Ruminococcaceae bacterium]|nr:endolytic transglycosylase MltG [Oscillospiraceae bacterium]
MAKRKRKKNQNNMFLGLLVIAFAFLYSFSVWQDYHGHSGEKTVEITVKEGSGTADIAKMLQENNIIEQPFWFRVFSKLGGHDGTYQHGRFTLPEHAGYEEIFHSLKHSQNSGKQVRVTIPEGYELRQIADTLEAAGLINRERFEKLVKNGDFDYWFLRGLPKRDNRLEGYLFPDTYLFTENDGEEAIIRTMLSRFDEIYTEAFRERAKALSMTDDEVITLASIIEREAMGDVDRKLVAGVFHNRLHSREYPYLQSCATVQYILKERKTVLSIADTNINSPYNTYQNPGLPIGPIASPGLEAIEAALYPEKTDYLFFVLDSTGQHRFAVTYAEHLENMKK